MKAGLRECVLKFMESIDTSEFSSNDFIYQFHKEEYMNMQNCQGFMYFSFYNTFINGPSVESILRSRRKVIADHGIGKRTKADTQKEYVEEFARQNKF